MERAVGVVGRALITQARMRLAFDVLGDSCRKAGLADPWLARDQHHLPFAFPGKALPFHQEIDLIFATNEIGKARRADRLETALRLGYALDRPRRDGLSNARELLPPEVTQMK